MCSALPWPDTDRPWTANPRAREKPGVWGHRVINKQARSSIQPQRADGARMTPSALLLTCWLSSVRLRSVSMTSSALAASIRPALNAETLTHATEYAKTCTSPHTTYESQSHMKPSPYTGPCNVSTLDRCKQTLLSVTHFLFAL